MAIVEVSIAPLGTAEPGVSRFVVGCLKVLQESGLSYQLNPMGTIIEGDLDAIFPVLRRMMEAPFGQGAVRVSTQIKVDDRRDRSDCSMDGKVATVTRQLGEGS